MTEKSRDFQTIACLPLYMLMTSRRRTGFAILVLDIFRMRPQNPYWCYGWMVSRTMFEVLERREVPIEIDVMSPDVQP